MHYIPVYPYYGYAPSCSCQRQFMFHPSTQEYHWQRPNSNIHFSDQGGKPFTVNIELAAKRNNNFRTALWTGKHLQVTLMSIDVGGDVGLEVHPELDQFLRIEQGQGVVQMGNTKNNFSFERRVEDNDAIMVPAGTWHNLTNTGNVPLKLYSIYAPPEHPFGTVHLTQAEAMEAEHTH